jgi:hypothetical protein
MLTEDMKRSLRTIKIIQVLLILAVLIFLDILIRFPIPPPFSISSETLNLIIIILAILGAVDLAYSYFLPRLLIKSSKRYKRKPPIMGKSQVFSNLIVRGAMLEAIAIYGLVLGIMGASLKIVLPFFIITVAGLLLTFPTKNKWNKLTALIETPTENTIGEDHRNT